MRVVAVSAIMCALHIVVPSRANAQLFDKLSNPKITVTLHHPPGLGLKVSRIAFAQPRGDKGDQVTDALAADFVSAGVEVLDRQHLEATLAEHRLNTSGLLNQQTTARLGQLLGSTALLFINVQRAATGQASLRQIVTDSRRQQHVQFFSQTKAYVKVSIQTVDLTTGRTLQAKVFEVNPVRATSSLDVCCAEFPSSFEVLDLGINEVVAQAHRLFVPWEENQSLYFFDDKECGMKTAFGLLKGGDIEGAHKESLASVEACRADPKMNDKKIAHSLYNAGMAAFLLDDVDTALDFLSQAQKVKDIGITSDAMLQIRRAKALAEESRLVDARTAQAALAAAPEPPPPPPASLVLPLSIPRPGASEAKRAVRPKAQPAGEVFQSSAPANKPRPPRVIAAPETGRAPVKAQGTVAERLRALNDLFKNGLVSQQEYDTKKAAILKGM